MNLMGWYKTEDETGGGTNYNSETELIVHHVDNEGNYVYRDERTVQKYYKKNAKGNYLKAFEAQYHPAY